MSDEYYNGCNAYEEQPQKQKVRFGWGGVMGVLLGLMLIAVVAGYFVGRDAFGGKDPAAREESEAGQESREESRVEPQESGSESRPWIPAVEHEIDAMTYAEIAAKAAPSVVEIVTEYVTTGSWMQQYVSSGAGSGVIITSDGYILTNNHVIEDAETITVTLRSGETYPARLMGLDEEQDVALIKIDATGLTPAEFGTSADLVVGQEVVAIGNPLGQLGGTVTNGIVSALNRMITMSDGTVMNLLQTNAAINPGNSGGGLFDAAGRLIALVNAKYADAEVEGLGFAIPIDDVTKILDDLYDYGYVRKGRVTLGITTVDVNSAARAWQYRVNELGLYIYSVTRGSAADKAGLKAGDMILALNGREITGSDVLIAGLGELTPGDVFTMTIKRNGSEQTFSVTATEYIPEAILKWRYAE